MASTTCSGNFNFRPSAKDLFSASTIFSSTLTASSVVSGSSPVGAAYVILMKRAVVVKYNFVSYKQPVPAAMSVQHSEGCGTFYCCYDLN